MSPLVDFYKQHRTIMTVRLQSVLHLCEWWSSLFLIMWPTHNKPLMPFMDKHDRHCLTICIVNECNDKNIYKLKLNKNQLPMETVELIWEQIDKPTINLIKN